MQTRSRTNMLSGNAAGGVAYAAAPRGTRVTGQKAKPNESVGYHEGHAKMMAVGQSENPTAVRTAAQAAGQSRAALSSLDVKEAARTSAMANVAYPPTGAFAKKPNEPHQPSQRLVPSHASFALSTLAASSAAAAPEEAMEISSGMGPASDDNLSADISLEIEDIDEYDRDDPQQATAYVQEIFDYQFAHELETMPNPQYLHKVQRDINERMRGIMVDWMIKNCAKLSLLSETAFLAVNLMDRFLSKKEITRHRLQLIGVGCMLIAAKYEEMQAPIISDYEYISGQACKREEILRIEKILLMTLNFDLTHSSPLHFLRRFSKAARSSPRTHTLSKYLTEMSMPDVRFLAYRPSLIAAAAVYLARRLTVAEADTWNSTLQHYSRYREADLRACVRDMMSAAIQPAEDRSPFTAVRAKYAQSNLLQVSLIPASVATAQPALVKLLLAP